MPRKTPEIVICLLIFGTVVVVYVITQGLKLFFDESPTDAKTQLSDNWILRLCLNLIGYATIIVPGYIIFRYVKIINYIDRAGSGWFPNIIRLCFASSEVEKLPETTPQTPIPPKTLFQESLVLGFCFLGLQTTYLTWGILQEKIMTQEYVDNSGSKGHFKDSQFLVFINRILAFILSGGYLILTRQPRHTAPLYKYVYCSFSNIMSSWCQYEALKYISFPTQVLAKASKIIPVMVMGKIISRKKYEYYEYATAMLISVGMTLFMLGSAEDRPGDHVTTVSGIILLASYMLFDSFTSNWQGALFNTYHMSSVQMMCGVNLFSCLFTTVSLAQQGGFIMSLSFMSQFPKFIFDCLLLSICSAAGQLFIFYTISNFGAVVFVIIMTIRQGLAILLSCLIYHHDVTALGMIGVFIVFMSIFLRIYCSQRLKTIKRRRIQAASTNYKV